MLPRMKNPTVGSCEARSPYDIEKTGKNKKC